MLDISNLVDFDHSPNAKALALHGSNEKFDHPDEADSHVGNALQQVGMLVAACLAIGGGTGLFHNWRGRITQALVPAFRLFLLIKDDPALVGFVAENPILHATAATRKNPALVAVKLTARPKTDDQHKLCSDWAACLNYALMKGEIVETFEKFMSEVTIAEAKREVAKAKRSGSSENLPNPFVFKIQLQGCDGPTKKDLRLSEVVHGKLLGAMKASLTNAELIRCLGEALSAYEAEDEHVG